MNTNKFLYIVVAIVVATGGYLAFMSLSEKAEAPTVDDNEEAENLPVNEDAKEDETVGDPQLESEADAAANTGGNDIGMEFPDPDAGDVSEMVVETQEVSPADDATDVAAQSFTLDAFNFGYSQKQLTVKQGETVTITLTNSDGFHDIVIDEFVVASEKIRTGETTSVTFVASEVGSFEYYCSVGSHRANGMFGTLVVE